MTRKHYENFPVASMLLPKNIRKHVAAIYAFARTADDYADEPGCTPDERLAKLQGWEEKLLACNGGSAEDQIFLALGDTIRTFDIPVELFQALLKAFRSDVTVARYAAFKDLSEYCRNSANPVGRLILLLFGYRNEQLFGYSDSICTALQLTNFWQDVSVDIQKGRLYFPLEDIGRFGCTEKELLGGVFNKEAEALIHFEVARTEEFFYNGKPLFSAIDKRLQWELKLTWNGGMRILEKIRALNFNSIHRRPKLTPADKAALLFRSFFL
ncbi:MAG: squalene synthase HpnC [Bacteroidota bacterium]